MGTARSAAVPDGWPTEGAWVVVCITEAISGTRNGVAWPGPGGLALVPHGEAMDLIKQHRAELAEDTEDLSGVLVF